MTPENYREFRDKYFGLVSNYVLDEVQEEKIKYITNGFINLSQVSHIKEDFVLTYYDTLKDLRIIDIDILKLYYESYNPFTESGKTLNDIFKEYNIDYDQYDAIREKLARLGVLTTKREKKIDDLYNNILNMQDYLEDLKFYRENSSLEPMTDEAVQLLVQKIHFRFQNLDENLLISLYQIYKLTKLKRRLYGDR